ncbi:CBN-SRB-16 protein [Caenorhabditis brenneri]|uniref:CBN-SRB-16 protein n=1 Tax=Caenorhabditis brenneri TaxID=135651 RepID=G0NAP9_CAEBE|nr:CBN-SRB-16 protein [Caenorhabditis brenneri]
MSYDTSYMKDECANTIHFVPFQLGLVLHSSAAIASFYATFYFLEKYIKNSPIHNNFKFLLLLYFFNSYARGVLIVGSAFSVLYRVYIFNGTEQNLFMNSLTFRFFHLFFALSLVMDATIKALLVFERTVATGKVEKYETQKSRNSCWTYLIIILVFPICAIYVTYRTADFSQPSCFAFFAPKNTEHWINILFIAAFLFSAISFIILRLLILLNTKKLKVYNFQLTARYQIRENLTCTHLVSSVLLTSLLVTVFYGLSMSILRMSQFQVFQENRMLFNMVKLSCYPFTFSDLFIPIYSGSQMNRTKTAKVEFLNNSVNTCRSRQHATEIYEKELRKQWA